MKTPTRRTLPAFLATAIAAVAFAAPVAEAKPGAEVAQAKRIAYNQIKNSEFVGVRGDGESVEAIFCADGKYENNVGGGISKGKNWKIEKAVVKQNGTWINAFVSAPGGFEIALTRRGTVWKFGVASLGRILYPGPVDKTRATTADCAAL